MSKAENVLHLARGYAEEANRRLGSASIINPWSANLTPLQRAEQHLYLLGQTYGEGHPGSAEPPESLMERQTKGQMLTWIIYSQGYPVGMANLDVADHGVGELCRTVELPVGTLLGSGRPYTGEVKTSAVAYQRLADALTHPDIVNRIWALEADLRLAREITLPSGKTLEAGVKTQHINRELKPMLLCVPRYRVSPEHGHSHQEAFSQSRRYFEPEKIAERGEPVYTPANIHGSVSIAQIASATYPLSFGFVPDIVSAAADGNAGEPVCALNKVAGIHFSTLHLSGHVPDDQIMAQIRAGLEASRFVEIIVLNRPENIELQQRLYKLGLVPLGAMAGGNFTLNGGSVDIPTTIHFGIARQQTIREMVEVELANEYKNTEIDGLTHQLREQWRKKGE